MLKDSKISITMPVYNSYYLKDNYKNNMLNFFYHNQYIKANDDNNISINNESLEKKINLLQCNIPLIINKCVLNNNRSTGDDVNIARDNPFFFNQTIIPKESKDVNEDVSINDSSDHSKDNKLNNKYKLANSKSENSTFKFSIIVSIYNNGEYLKNVCFSSLKKISIFNDIEIILVDDGSTDNSTIEIIKDLEKSYKNVKTYFFNDGGSGSPSRPRNMGAKLSTTNYITYLDPDNEAYGDGYTKLYNEITSDNYDLVIGEIIFKNHMGSRPNSYCKEFLNSNNNNPVLDNGGKDMLLKTNFSAQSIQACLIKKSFLVNNNLEMVFGGAGEDTLFFYELLVNSQKTKVINDIIHIYHMSREDSITNDIDRSFFKKHLPVEMKKRNFLEKFGLLSQYIEKKHDFYFKHFIFIKLNNVIDESEKEFCFNYIDRMYKVFYDVWIVKDPILRDYFQSRNIYRNKPFNESLVVSLQDNSIRDTLDNLEEKDKLDDIEIILVDYHLLDSKNINLAQLFESTHKNVKLYYKNPKEKLGISELEQINLNMLTTNNITYIN